MTQSGSFFPKSGHYFRFSKKAAEVSPLIFSRTPVSVAEYASISLSIPKYPWKCLNKLSWLCQCSEYAWSSYMFDMILMMFLVLNKPGFWMCHGCICKGYTEFRICMVMAPYTSLMPKYAWIWLNVFQYAWTWLNIAECPWICLKMPE